MVLRAAPCTLLCCLTLSLLAGCGAGGGEGAADRPSVTASLSPTRTPPSPTRTAVEPTATRSVVKPTPTRSAVSPTPTQSAVSPTPTQSEAPRPSRTPSQSPNPTSTGPTRTSEPAQQPTTVTSTVDAEPAPTVEASSASASASPSTAPAAGEAAQTPDEGPVPAGVWVLLAVLVAAVAAGAWLLMRSRKRHAWLERLRAAETEVAWFSGELIPQLRSSGSVDRVVGGWQVAVPRVAAAEDQLTGLESSARTDEDAARARRLRDAVRSASRKVDTLAGLGVHDEWVLDLDDAQAQLLAALGPAPAGSGAVSGA